MNVSQLLIKIQIKVLMTHKYSPQQVLLAFWISVWNGSRKWKKTFFSLSMNLLYWNPSLTKNTFTLTIWALFQCPRPIYVLNTRVWFYLGLNDRSQEGSFKWTDGSSVNLLYWGSDYPNGGDVQNCVVLVDSIGLLWADVGCDHYANFICKSWKQ